MDAWTESLRRGDNEAYELLFKKYWNKLVFYAEKIVWDVDDAADLVQNSFVNLYNNRALVEGQSHAVNLLYLHVKNRAKTVLQARERRDRRENKELEEQKTAEVSAEFDWAWIFAQIMEIIAELPEKQQQAIMNRAVNGSRSAGIKDNTEYTNSSRARATIKKKFAERLSINI